jgi:hypothetical protein
MKLFRVEFYRKPNGTIYHIFLFIRTEYYHNILHDKLLKINQSYVNPWLGHGVMFYDIKDWNENYCKSL